MVFHSRCRRQRRLVACTAIVLLGGCGSDPAGPSPTPPVIVPTETLARIDVAPTSVTLAVGDTVRLVATARSTSGAAMPAAAITWQSANPAVASVTAQGLVTAIAPGGPVAFTATSGAVQGTAQVTVTPAPVASITIAPASATLTVGETQTLAATLRDARGTLLTDRAVSWSSSNSAVASVSQGGAVTAVGIGGPVSITATSEGRTASAAVTVRPVPAARVVLTAPGAEFNDPSTVTVSVQVQDAAGQNLTGRTVTWTSDSVHVATVDASGVVRSVRAGVTRIRARVDNVEGTLVLTFRGLMHRWTFAEEGAAGTVFVDDVRGARATLVNAGVLDGAAVGGQVTLTGGAQANADFVAMPGGLLRGATDATIEVWATMHTLKTWSRVLDIGSSPGNSLFVAWSQGRIPGTDRVGFTVNGVEHRLDNALAPITPDLEHHIVLMVDGDAGASGLTRVSLFRDGMLRGSFETSHRLSDLVDANFWLGRSHHADETASASYEEIRVHDRVYPAAEVAQMFARGPVRDANGVTLDVQTPDRLRDTIRGVGSVVPLRVVGRDARGRQFQTSGARWTSSNPAIATVDTSGVVTSRAVGRVDLIATVGTLSVRRTLDVVRVRRLPVDPYLATPISGALAEVPVVLIEYLPTSDGTTLDVLRAPDYWVLGPMSLDSTEATILTIARRRKMMVEQGSRYRGYLNPSARASLGYRVVEHILVYDQIPPHPTKRAGLPGAPRYENWHTVFSDLQLDPLMRSRTVRELWVAWSGFDGNYPSYNPARHRVEEMRAGWESNMASPTTGDISNSDRDGADAPLLPHTYIIYGINFRRSQAEAVHNVGHQLEAMFSYVATRQDGTDRLFWRDFVGQNAQRQFITGRAGWTHMPPNTVQDYDYLNATPVASDIEDWRPSNTGAKSAVNVDTWGRLTFPWPGAQDFPQRVESQWYIYWFQNMPGLANTIPYTDVRTGMTNWWQFVSDWDASIRSGLGLHWTLPGTAASLVGGYAFPGSAWTPRVVRDERRPPRPETRR